MRRPAAPEGEELDLPRQIDEEDMELFMKELRLVGIECLHNAETGEVGVDHGGGLTIYQRFGSIYKKVYLHEGLSARYWLIAQHMRQGLW